MKKTLETIILVTIMALFASCTSIQEQCREYPTARIYYKNLAKYKSYLDQRKARSAAIIPVGLYKRNEVMTEEEVGWDYAKESDYEIYTIRLSRNFSLTLLTVIGVLYRYKEINTIRHKAYFYREVPLGYSRFHYHFTGGIVNIYVDKQRNLLVMHCNNTGQDYYIIGYVDRWKASRRLF
ncbi:MAG: hypothetical protein JXA20_09045 [Spirochaetes bacterium]|nr:hypothetical protein [Spirochaetota bacterium]